MNPWGPGQFYGQQPQPPWWWYQPQPQQPTAPSVDEVRKAYKAGKKEYKKFLKWKAEEEKSKPKDDKKPKISVLQWTIIYAFLTITIGPWVAFLFTASMHSAIHAIGAMLK
jgi:hypothetical protein